MTDSGKLTADAKSEIRRDQCDNHRGLVEVFSQRVSTTKLHCHRHALDDFERSGLTAEDLSMVDIEHFNGPIKRGSNGTAAIALQTSTSWLQVMELVSRDGVRDPTLSDVVHLKGRISTDELRRLRPDLLDDISAHCAGRKFSAFANAKYRGVHYTSELYRLGAIDQYSLSDALCYKTSDGEVAYGLLRLVVASDGPEGDRKTEFAIRRMFPTPDQPLPALSWMKRVELDCNEDIRYVPSSDVIDNVFFFLAPGSADLTDKSDDGSDMWISDCVGKLCFIHSPIRPQTRSRCRTNLR